MEVLILLFGIGVAIWAFLALIGGSDRRAGEGGSAPVIWDKGHYDDCGASDGGCDGGQ